MRGRWGALVAGALLVTLGTAVPAHAAAPPERAAARIGTVQTAPLPPDAATSKQQVSLADVDCPAQNTCMAVGSYLRQDGATVPLAESYRNGTWSPTALEFPGDEAAGATAVMERVVCTAPTFCVALGRLGAEFSGRVLAQVWDGQTWSADAIALPGGASPDAYVSEVSCVSADFCLALGTDWGPVTEYQFTLVWNGRRWSARKLPEPAGVKDIDLSSVACASARSCLAVGGYWVGDGAEPSEQGPYAMAYANGAWSVAPGGAGPRHTSLSKFSGVTSLDDVVCVAADRCVAVGYGSPMYRLDGGTGGFRGPKSELPYSSAVAELTCSTIDTCIVVGSQRTDYYHLPGPAYVARIAGDQVKARRIKMPRGVPKGSPDTAIRSMVCRNLSRCVGVGWFAKTKREVRGVVVRTSPRVGKAIRAPRGATSSELTAVDRTSPRRAVAVGSYEDATGQTLGLIVMRIGV